MATSVVITVPDDVYQGVARLAQLTHRDAEAVSGYPPERFRQYVR